MTTKIKWLNLVFLHVARNFPIDMDWDHWNHHWYSKRMQRKYRELHKSMRELDMYNQSYISRHWAQQGTTYSPILHPKALAINQIFHGIRRHRFLFGSVSLLSAQHRTQQVKTCKDLREAESSQGTKLLDSKYSSFICPPFFFLLLDCRLQFQMIAAKECEVKHDPWMPV